jgi:hypothetical protein
MHQAGLLDVWHMLGAIVARQSPFAQIMIYLGAALFITMALEGVRTSVRAMRLSKSPVQAGDTVTGEAPPPSTAKLQRLNAAKLASSTRRATPVRGARPLSFAKKG